MSVSRLSLDALKVVLMYLDTETVLALIATGSRYFSAIFAPNLLNSVSYNIENPLKLLRDTFTYVLRHHKHLKEINVVCSPWTVAVPFLGVIPDENVLESIYVGRVSNNYSARNQHCVQQADLRSLGEVPGLRMKFQLYTRFTHLQSLKVAYELPAAVRLDDGTVFWPHFFDSLPKTLKKLSLICRAFPHAIQAIVRLPSGLQELALEAADYTSSQDGQLNYKSVSQSFIEHLPLLSSLRLSISRNIFEIGTGEHGSRSEDESVALATSGNGECSDDVLVFGNNISVLNLVSINGTFPMIRIASDMPINREDLPMREPLLAELSLSCRYYNAFTNSTLKYTLLNLSRGLVQLSMDLDTAIISDSNWQNALQSLPPSLRFLDISAGFVSKVEEYLPRGLEALRLKCRDREVRFEGLPPSLTSFDTDCYLPSLASCKFVTLPPRLQKLRVALQLSRDWADSELLGIQTLFLASLPELVFTIIPSTAKIMVTGITYPPEVKALDCVLWKKALFDALPCLSPKHHWDFRIKSFPNTMTEVDTLKLMKSHLHDHLKDRAPGFENTLYSILMLASKQLTSLTMGGNQFSEAQLINLLGALENLNYLECSIDADKIRPKSLPLFLETYINHSKSENLASHIYCHDSSSYWLEHPPGLTTYHVLAPIAFTNSLPTNIFPAEACQSLTSLCWNPVGWKVQDLAEAVKPLTSKSLKSVYTPWICRCDTVTTIETFSEVLGEESAHSLLLDSFRATCSHDNGIDSIE